MINLTKNEFLSLLLLIFFAGFTLGLLAHIALKEF